MREIATQGQDQSVMAKQQTLDKATFPADVLPVRLHTQTPPVRAHRHQPIPIGAEDFGVMLAQPFEHVVIGVAVAVVDSHRDDGESRIGRS